MITILALGTEWLAYGVRAEAAIKAEQPPNGVERLHTLSRYPALQQPCTAAWHPEHISIGVASFEGDPKHATTLLERKLRAQGEISSDVKILILESQQVGRGYQVLYVTVALDEWQQMLSWAGSQQHICRLTLVTALAFQRVQVGCAVVLHAGRHFHFFARHDGQLVHLQAVSVDDNLGDLQAVASMLGGQARDEMAARGCNQFDVLWVPAAFKGTGADLSGLTSAFAEASQAVVELESESLGPSEPTGVEVHSGLVELSRRARPKDLLNQGEDKLHVLAREYLPYGAVAAVAAALGLAYVGYGWMAESASLRQRAQQLQAEEASVRQSISVIARDTALERPAVNRQVDILQMLKKVEADHDPVHLLHALKEGAQGGIRILSVSSIRPAAAAGDASKADTAPAMVVDGTNTLRFVYTVTEDDVAQSAVGEPKGQTLTGYGNLDVEVGPVLPTGASIRRMNGSTGAPVMVCRKTEPLEDTQGSDWLSLVGSTGSGDGEDPMSQDHEQAEARISAFWHISHDPVDFEVDLLVDIDLSAFDSVSDPSATNRAHAAVTAHV